MTASRRKRRVPRRLRALRRWSNGFAKGRKPDVARQLRYLRRWAERFAGQFPDLDESIPDNEYTRWKLPCSLEIVEGRHALRSTQIASAQALIDAVGHLVAAKPTDARDFRVTCTIYPGGLWESEVCIYHTEKCWLKHTRELESPTGKYSRIHGRSLAADWALHLPASVQELGLRCEPGPQTDPEYWHSAYECWYYGEVD
jgi:hypothetical protein